MVYLNEQEIINKFLELVKENAKKKLNISLNLKKIRIHNPENTEDYCNYKNGESSTNVNVDFEMHGWKSYSDEGFEDFCRNLLVKDENFYPITNLDVYEVLAKGKINVNMSFSFVFTKIDVQNETFWSEQNGSNTHDTGEIIREIEIRLSEIYSLLSKLKEI